MSLSPFLQKLLFVKQFSMKDGKISLLGDRHIMLDASNILALQDIDKTRMYNTVKSSSLNHMKDLVNHAEVYKNIKNQSLRNIANLSKKIGKSDEGVIKTLQTIFDIYGLGKLKIVNLDNANSRASIIVQDSTLGRSSLEGGRSRVPVCTLTSGILAGIFSFIFNKNVDCSEKKCIASGSDRCFFEVG